jgi:putative membrane-bound dehydrogenase-like protein
MRLQLWITCLLAGPLFGLLMLPPLAGDNSLATKGPLSPTEEKTTFRLAKGFHVELVAAEPDVIDPVALAFDENGRLFVAEMRGYPNGGVGTGTITSGRIRMLEDVDGDGYFEKATVFADNLRFPMGVQPWRGGLLVTIAPDLLYLEDTRGAGKSDRRRVLYTGFDLANIQQLVNSPQWALDNWVYACGGGSGGVIRSAEKPDMPAVTLRGNRGIRFHPETPGSLEPTSGGTQYGLAPDEWQRWFASTNSQHLRHIVLPDHYLRRNPDLAVPAVTIDIPDHGPACKVHRISPFEPWRVERTTRRSTGPDSARFPPNELVPGGFITSGCSPVIYAADAYPEAYRDNSFMCDPANNLIHRDVLVPSGATFTARRAAGEESSEFLASTDNWFRPVHLSLGPDGCLYILDFYREVIETPLSLPEDIKKRLNLESRGRGRIWRVVADGADGAKKARRRPALGKAASKDLVPLLADPNLWWRLTAQRLLVERQDKSVIEAAEKLAQGPSAVGRGHALWTLHGLKGLRDEVIEAALKDAEPGVREQALRLADERLASSAPLRKAVAALAHDPSPRVRFQLAFTLGQTESPETTAALAKVAAEDAADPWIQTAVLSSAGRSAERLLALLARDRRFTDDDAGTRLPFVSRLAAQAATRTDDEGLTRLFRLLALRGDPRGWQLALLDGIGQGLQNNSRSLGKLWDSPPPALKPAMARARQLFEEAATAARDTARSATERGSAIRLLGRGPFALLSVAAPELLATTSPPEVQIATIRALSGYPEASVAGLLLKPWGTYTPSVRREAVEAMFARSDRLPHLLDAIEHKTVLAAQLEPVRLDQLRKHADATIRERSRKALAGQVAQQRQTVVAAYRAALKLDGDVPRGRAVFRKNCTPCHRLENEGFEVGPDLLSALRNKSPEQLLDDILDPSREVDPRYLNYVVETKTGRMVSGLIAAETATSMTLRRGERAEETVLRSQIEEVQATGKSLMPEGLEAQLSKQDVADLIAYLRKMAVP